MTNNYLNQLLIKHRSSFSAKDQEIAKYFKTIGTSVMNKTLSELSEEINASEASIYNFVKKLGFKGFQEFKIAVAAQSTPKADNQPTMTAFSDIERGDDPLTIAKKIIDSNAQSIKDLTLSLDEKVLLDALELIKEASVIHFFGVGASSIVAFDSFHKFHRSHLRCNYIIDSHMQLTYATKLNHNDCAFIFSHTGNTIETIEIAEILHSNNVKIISMTGNPNSKLAELSDVSFVVYSEEFAFRSESLTARFLYLTLVDILYVCLMYQYEEKNIDSLKAIRKAIAKRRLK